MIPSIIKPRSFVEPDSAIHAAQIAKRTIPAESNRAFGEYGSVVVLGAESLRENRSPDSTGGAAPSPLSQSSFSHLFIGCPRFGGSGSHLSTLTDFTVTFPECAVIV